MSTDGPPMPAAEALLERLTPPQREAVTYGDGPLLIFAGAGSGKTLDLTARIAYLIATKRVWPDPLLPVTFTNNTEKELRARVAILSLQRADTQLSPPFPPSPAPIHL